MTRAFVTLDLNQSGWPQVPSHKLAKTMDGAFERDKAPRPNECGTTIDACPWLERLIGVIFVGRQYAVQPRPRILDM